MAVVLTKFPVVNLFPGWRLPGGRDPVEIRFYDDFGDVRGEGTHHAQDIKGPLDMGIVSTTNGAVVQSWKIGARRLRGMCFGDRSGWLVVIVDAQGYFHHYAHMQPVPVVQPGQRVVAGQLIGRLGQSGNARNSVPHLHYQVRSPIGNASEYQTLDFSSQGGAAVPVHAILKGLALAAGWQQLSAVRYQWKSAPF
ncbi:MAG: M23 family metallopeptidase [Bryobacteraceae bacterium]